MVLRRASCQAPRGPSRVRASSQTAWLREPAGTMMILVRTVLQIQTALLNAASPYTLIIAQL